MVVMRYLLLAMLCACVGGETLAELISSSPQLGRFWALMNGTGVKEVLDGEGVFTVFAPTNEAINEFMVPGVLGILKKDEDFRRRLISYHVVVASKPLRVEDVPGSYAGMATTLWGTKMLLESASDVVKVNGKSQVIQADAAPDATNGMIHIVNGVLSYSGWFPEEDLVTLLRKDSKLRAFYVTMWDVKEEIGLTERGPLTIFVPTNKAFARAGLTTKGTSLSTLLEEDREKIIRILRYHIVHTTYLTREDLQNPGIAQTIDVHAGRANYIAYQRDGSGTVDINNGEAKLEVGSKASVQATNGVYHVIDKLLLPPGVEVPDVNYSSTKNREHKEALLATPEPLTQITAPTTPKAKKKSPVPMLLMVSFVFLLIIHRLAAPPESHLDKRKRKPDIVLAVALVLLSTVFLFPTMKWVLPPGLRWASDEVRGALFRAAAPMAEPEPGAATNAMYGQQFDNMLNHLELQGYRSKLLAYGLDRIDLIAIATAEDGERAGVKLAHWGRLQSEARTRHPVSPDRLDPTPEPPSVYKIGGNRHNSIDIAKKEELGKAEMLAYNFDKEAMEKNNESPTTPPPVPTIPPPVPKPPMVPVEDVTKKFVLAVLTIPSTGMSSVECTFGTKHGSFVHRDAAQLNNIRYIPIKSLSEVGGIRAGLGTKDYKDVSPRATVVTVLVATRPVARFVRSFYKSVGKTNTPESDFKCEMRMKDKMKGAAFSLEDYARLPDVARKHCEATNNPMVKALTNLPPTEVATQTHYDAAVRAVKDIDVLMIDEENEKKSMLGLLTKVNLTEGSYIPCTPYEDASKIEYSLRASDVIARDNNMDRMLFSEIHHVFNTKYAGTFEMTTDASKVECDEKPTVCFDENDRNGEKKAKDLFVNVNSTLHRSSSRQSVMCAGYCKLPKETFSV